VALAAFASFSLAACGSSSAGGDAKSITFYVNVTPTLTKSFWQKQVDGFEKTHSGETVKLVDSKGQDVTKYFATLAASGSVPDVIGVPPGDMDRYHTLLHPFDTSEKWVQFPGYQDQEYDGKLYGVSSATTAYGLIFYNKDYFQKAGITSTPTSMDELTADMAKLKSAGYVPLETSGDFVLGFQFTSLTYPTLFSKDPQFYSDVAAGEATFDDSAFQQVASYYSDWVKKGYFNKGAMSTTYDTSEKDFAQGATAMYPLAGWYTPALNEAKSKYDIGVFPVPTVDGSAAPLEVDPINTYYISNKVKNYDLAEEFVKYLSTDETAVRNFITADGDYSTATPPVQRAMSPIEKDIAGLIDKAVAATSTVPCCEGAINSGNGAPGIQDELNTLAGDLQLGKSPDGFGAKLDDWWAQNKS
jgi:multiple sugar transport system substrate-binding protein/raffinose/stachyose/melibiose transport system substrate-binding protein